MNKSKIVRAAAVFSLDGGIPNLEIKEMGQELVFGLLRGSNVTPLLLENLKGVTTVGQAAGRSFDFAKSLLGEKSESKAENIMHLIDELKEFTKFAIATSNQASMQNANDAGHDFPLPQAFA
jgi:hypothetical protein